MTENQNIKRKIDLSPFRSGKFLRAWFNYLRLVASICLAYMFSCYLVNNAKKNKIETRPKLEQ